MWSPPKATPNVPPTRKLAFDVVGVPSDVDELAHLIQLMCDAYMKDRTNDFKVHTAILGVLQYVQQTFNQKHDQIELKAKSERP